MLGESELDEFYRRIGAALYHLQFLEDALVTFLVMKIIHESRCAGHTVSETDAETLLSDKRRTLTLGPLIDSCISKKIIRTPEHQNRIKAFKRERDWLVHRSMIENGDDLYVATARNEIFSRITAIQGEAISLKAVFFEDLKVWAAAHDVDVGAAHNQAEAEARNLKTQP